MPKLDKHHNTVKRALAKDEWLIIYDPFLLKYKGLHLYIDLAAEKNFNDKRIAIEIKVFESDSLVNDFEKAIGQYNLYRFIMGKIGLQYELYLAITEKVYRKFNDKPAILEYISQERIYLLIFDAETEEILQWIK